MTFESRRREPSRLYRLELSVRQKVVGPYGPTPRHGRLASAAPCGTALCGATSARPTGGLSRGPTFRTPLEQQQLAIWELLLLPFIELVEKVWNKSGKKFSNQSKRERNYLMKLNQSMLIFLVLFCIPKQENRISIGSKKLSWFGLKKCLVVCLSKIVQG